MLVKPMSRFFELGMVFFRRILGVGLDMAYEQVEMVSLLSLARE